MSDPSKSATGAPRLGDLVIYEPTGCLAKIVRTHTTQYGLDYMLRFICGCQPVPGLTEDSIYDEYGKVGETGEGDALVSPSLNGACHLVPCEDFVTKEEIKPL